MSKHLPQTQRVTGAAYKVEDKLHSLAAITRRGAWGSPEPRDALPTRHDPYRLPLPEVTRKEAELAMALHLAANLLEEALAHLEDTTQAQADAALSH